MTGIDLIETTDAVVWANEFVRIKNAEGWTLDDIDEGLMIGWFSNAFYAQERKNWEGVTDMEQQPNETGPMGAVPLERRVRALLDTEKEHGNQN